VLKKQEQGEWKDFTGEEKIVQGGHSALTDGQEVKIATDVNPDEAFPTAQRNAVHGKK
jgi:hypothetical protein